MVLTGPWGSGWNTDSPSLSPVFQEASEHVHMQMPVCHSADAGALGGTVGVTQEGSLTLLQVVA